MKVSQIKVLSNEEEVNNWLLLNGHLEVLNVTMSSRGEGYGRRDFFIIHYKVNIVKV